MLETIVRPFQIISVFGTRRVVTALSDASTPPEPVTLAWGDAGTLPTPVTQTDPDPVVNGFKVEDCDNKYKENGRTIEITRVSNPQDDSQYVDVESVKTIKFGKVQDTASVAVASGVGTGTVATSPNHLQTVQGQTVGVTFQQDCNEEYKFNKATGLTPQ